MTLHVPLLLALSLLGFGAPATAQKLYRCGNTYSQTPCGPEASERRLHADRASEGPAGLSGAALCAAAAVKVSGSPEPETARVAAVGARRSEVIQYAGQPIASFRHDLTVDARTAQGVYSGPVAYSCWLSEDQRRVLQFAASRGR